jgi:hypothetical protein
MEKRVRRKRRSNPFSLKRIQGKLNTLWNKHWDIVIAVVVGFVISQLFLLWLLK